MIHKSLGFTMIELLVVICIIGIIGVMGGAAYTNSLQKGRDARRVEDMKAVQKGFEMYYAKQMNDTGSGSYSNDCNNMFNDRDIFPAGKPVSPKTTGDYAGECTATTYYYCAILERPDEQGNAHYVAAAQPVFQDKTAETTNAFCVTNLQ